MNSHGLVRQLGTFSIPEELIRKSPSTVFSILSTVIPVRAEYMYISGCIEYTAISHSFNKVQEGEIPSRYRAIVNGQFIRWEKDE